MTPRPPTPQEQTHPLALPNAQVIAETHFDDTTDSVMVATNTTRRILEIYEEFDWLEKTRTLGWAEFETLAEESKRQDWPKSVQERLAQYSLLPQDVRVVIGDHFTLQPWVLGFEVL